MFSTHLFAELSSNWPGFWKQIQSTRGKKKSTGAKKREKISVNYLMALWFLWCYGAQQLRSWWYFICQGSGSDLRVGGGEDSWMLLSRTNITRYFPLYFLKQTQGCRMFTYTVCYCQCSFSSRHRETNFLWNNSRDDTGFSEVSQLRHGKTRLYLFRA